MVNTPQGTKGDLESILIASCSSPRNSKQLLRMSSKAPKGLPKGPQASCSGGSQKRKKLLCEATGGPQRLQGHFPRASESKTTSKK